MAYWASEQHVSPLDEEETVNMYSLSGSTAELSLDADGHCAVANGLGKKHLVAGQGDGEVVETMRACAWVGRVVSPDGT